MLLVFISFALCYFHFILFCIYYLLHKYVQNKAEWRSFHWTQKLLELERLSEMNGFKLPPLIWRYLNVEKAPKWGLISLLEARLHGCIKSAVRAVDAAAAAGGRSGNPGRQSLDAVTTVTGEGMRGFLSVAGFCFCFKSPYLCQVGSASAHLTACLALVFCFCIGSSPQTVPLSALALTCSISLFPKHCTSVLKFSHFTASPTREQEVLL